MLILVVFVLLEIFKENVSGAFKQKYLYSVTKNGLHYRVHPTPANWPKARLVCEAEGASLLVPETAQEFDEFKTIANNLPVKYRAIHVGIHGLYGQGHYTLLNGTLVSDTILELYWAPGNPDYLHVLNSSVVMNRRGLLEDQKQNVTNPFICAVRDRDIYQNYACNNYDKGYKVKTKTKCYKHHLKPLTWFAAFKVCTLELGRLATVTSEEDAKIIASYLNLENTELTTAPEPTIMFIGYTDLLYEHEYRYKQGPTTKEAGYDIWRQETDPNYKLDKFCGSITKEGLNRIANCEIPSMFLCESPINKTHSRLK